MEGWSYCRCCQEPVLVGMYCINCSEEIDFVERFVNLFLGNVKILSKEDIELLRDYRKRRSENDKI